MGNGYKVERHRIIWARANNPCATLQQIGDKYNISRERVRQILSEEDMPTTAVIERTYYTCLSCRVETLKSSGFCSIKCRHDYTYILVACEVCGKLKEYRAKEITNRRERLGLQNHFFCSRQCFGKWAANNYGFKASHMPGNHSQGDRVKWGKEHRKYDWSKVYELRDETGWGAIKLGRALGIPVATVSRILSLRRR